MIARARRNDNDAIQQLMEQYKGMVRYQARMYVKNEDDVNEIEQQVYIKAFSKTSDLTDEKKFGGWLKTIAINTAKDYVTSAFRKKSVMFTDLDDTNNDMVYDAADERIDHRPDVQMDETSRRDIILKVLDTLPETQRTVIVMHYYDNLSFRDIAEQLDIPMSTVTVRVQLAKNNIKASVTEIQNREGIKLYNLSPIAFFLWLLGLERTAPVAPPVVGKTVKVTKTEPAKKDKPNYGNHGDKVNKTVKAKTAKETAKATGKAAGTGLFASKAVKAVIAGVIGVAAAGGGSVAGMRLYHAKNPSGNAEVAEKNVNEKKSGSKKSSGRKSGGQNSILDEKNIVWIKKPGSMDIDDFDNLEGHSGNVDHGYVESTGYSPEWIGSMSNYNLNTDGQYSGNAIIVKSQKKKGIYDFDGNVIDDIQYDSVRAGNEVGVYFYAPSSKTAFDDMSGYFDYDFKPMSNSDVGDGWVVNSDGGSFYLYNDSINGNSDMPIDSFTDVIKGPVILPVLDQYYSDDSYLNEIGNINPSGFVILEQGKGRTELPAGMEPLYFSVRQKDDSGTSDDMDTDSADDSDRYETFVNGVVKLRDKNKKIHLWKYDTQKYVSDEAFDDATFYEDGYIGVKKKSKWAFMDENGKLVTDYMFDKVSGLYEGKVYVTYKGKPGIMDLKKSIENQKNSSGSKQKKSSGKQSQSADFSKVAGDYDLSSGAGAWGNELKVNADGSFTGEYSDGEMGITGPGYPHGMYAYAKYSGKFKDLKKLDDNRYQMTLDGSLQYANKVGTSEIKNEMLYSYTEARGV